MTCLEALLNLPWDFCILFIIYLFIIIIIIIGFWRAENINCDQLMLC